ncbi:MAG: alpha/beta hydrolase [Chitinophagales bacterium]|nr:alpha/beta hydrolase [Chitinophagales bacterium]
MSYIHTPYGQIHYQKIGQGERLMIALHGHGEDGTAFLPIEATLKNNITLYALDLPFHGKTQWLKDYYTPEQLCFVVESILAMENSRQFEALGHSLGGRLWLCLLPILSNRMTAAYLLAPDGLSTRKMSLVEWMPLVLKRSLGASLKRPSWAINLAEKLNRWQWLDLFSYRYLKLQLLEEERKICMLKTWYSLSYFRLGPQRAQKYLQQSGVPCIVLVGDQDRIISSSDLKNIFEPLPQTIFQEISANHKNITIEAQSYLTDGLVRYWKGVKSIRG